MTMSAKMLKRDLEPVVKRLKRKIEIMRMDATGRRGVNRHDLDEVMALAVIIEEKLEGTE